MSVKHKRRKAEGSQGHVPYDCGGSLRKSFTTLTLVLTNSITTVFCMRGKHAEAVVLLNKVVEKARRINSENLVTFLVSFDITKLRQGLEVVARKLYGEGLELRRKTTINHLKKQLLPVIILHCYEGFSIRKETHKFLYLMHAKAFWDCLPKYLIKKYI